MKLSSGRAAGFFLFSLCLLVFGGIILTGNHLVERPPVRALEASAPDFGHSSVGSSRTVDPATVPASWQQFRGVASRGVTKRSDLPVEWSAQKNLLWETEVLGRGASSPIANFPRIFLTSSSGYGESFDRQGEVRYLRHHVYCIDASTGKTIWRSEIQGSPITQALNHPILSHGMASSTPATDGSNVYAFFGASGVFKFDSAGNKVWHADVGFEHSKYGSAASLVIHKDLLIVNASAESESVFALDLKTGRGVWRIEDVKNSWSTPVVAKNQEGETELIIQDDGRLRGFDVTSGRELWRYQGPAGYAASTPFVEDGVCFYTAGQTRTLSAIKLGGNGDVTATHKFWSVDNVSRHTSPIYRTGFVYALSESGAFRCFQALDGKPIKSIRIPTSSRVYSSPILAGSLFYLPTGGNRFVVCRANSGLEPIRDNQIDKSVPVLASLCPSANSLLIRTDNRLFCSVNTERAKKVVPLVATEQEPIKVEPRFEFDRETLQLKRYNEFLTRDREDQWQRVLAPLRNTISYLERAKTSEWAGELTVELTALRNRQRSTYWKQLRGNAGPSRDPIVTSKTIEMELAAIEEATLAEVSRIRAAIRQRLNSSTVASKE